MPPRGSFREIPISSGERRMEVFELLSVRLAKRRESIAIRNDFFIHLGKNLEIVTILPVSFSIEHTYDLKGTSVEYLKDWTTWK